MSQDLHSIISLLNSVMWFQFCNSKVSLVLIITIGVINNIDTKILSAYVLPHGGIALDPTYFNTTNHTAKKEAWEIHRACVEVGNEISDKKPDLIFLSTPHGIADLKNFVFYLNPTGKGYADTDNCMCPPCCYEVQAQFANKIAANLTQYFGYKMNVSGLSGYGPPVNNDEPFPLRWGEVIPLYFVPTLNETKVIILSQPSRRYTEDVQMIPELLKLGNELYNYLNSIKETVVIIISADLAHTHSKDGPYGYSNTSEPFDQACGQWVQTLDGKSLLVTAAEYVDKALSCGYTGLVMLHGALSAGRLTSWTSRLFSIHHPSYYGMMVASFTKDNYCVGGC